MKLNSYIKKEIYIKLNQYSPNIKMENTIYENKLGRIILCIIQIMKNICKMY